MFPYSGRGEVDSVLYQIPVFEWNLRFYHSRASVCFLDNTSNSKGLTAVDSMARPNRLAKEVGGGGEGIKHVRTQARATGVLHTFNRLTQKKWQPEPLPSLWAGFNLPVVLDTLICRGSKNMGKSSLFRTLGKIGSCSIHILKAIHSNHS